MVGTVRDLWPVQDRCSSGSRSATVSVRSQRRRLAGGGGPSCLLVFPGGHFRNPISHRPFLPLVSHSQLSRQRPTYKFRSRTTKNKPAGHFQQYYRLFRAHHIQKSAMAQSYFPPRVTSPVKELANFSNMMGDRQLKVEDVQEAYIEQKDRCVELLSATLCSD